MSKLIRSLKYLWARYHRPARLPPNLLFRFQSLSERQFIARDRQQSCRLTQIDAVIYRVLEHERPRSDHAVVPDGYLVAHYRPDAEVAACPDGRAAGHGNASRKKAVVPYD